MGDSLRYALCSQTVTLYHPDPDAGSVTRTVVENAFLDRREKMNFTETGCQAAQAFLLVIPAAAGEPGKSYTLEPGDRVLEGSGPELSWQEWPEFVPALREGVCCVQYVASKILRGRFCHLEAGGWWTRSGSGAHSLTN